MRTSAFRFFLWVLLICPRFCPAQTPAGSSPHSSNPAPQVVRTPPTVAQPSVAEDLLSSAISSPPTPAAWVRQTIKVAPCLVPPKIDGRIEDVCWKTATYAGGFYRLGGTAPVSEQTEAWICADKTHLYLAFHCMDSHPEMIHASQIQRNGNIGQDDYVGIDIDSQNNRRSLSTFDVTPRGTQVEALEGGTADNITWAGDWKAATRRVSDGWTCEISIPFALLRYPKGAQAFGLDLFRKLGRETSVENWPYLPPDGFNNEPTYIHEFTGIAPPFYAPRPIFLPYLLTTAGAGSSAREGMDIKYPLSTTLTGVATLFPDFQTIEQDVTDINFSYTEKLLTDRRPFFAEGFDFLPYRDLFYSRRVGMIDGGLKVVGKQGDTALGLLASGTRGLDSQSDAVFDVSHDLGLFSRASVNYVSDTAKGQPSNQVAKVEGIYGWRVGQDHWSVQADHMPSWQGGLRQDSKDYLSFATSAVPGHPSFMIDRTDIGPNFISNLGYNPDLNEKGSSFNIDQYNNFDKGRLEIYDVTVSGDTYQHHTGAFFQNDFNTNIFLQERSGLSLNFNYDRSQRDDFHDHANQVKLGWGRKTLYQRGSISENFGRQENQAYNFVSFNAGILISHPFSLQLNFNQLKLGSTTTSQAVLTGNYLLNDVQSLGGRIVTQDGSTNIYFSFGQHVRSGSDLFLLFGDPNSLTTRGKITLKIIHPF